MKKPGRPVTDTPRAGEILRVTRSSEPAKRGRPRMWKTDAERVCAARARKAEAGLKEVRVALSAEAHAALEQLTRKLGATPSKALEYLLLAGVQPRRGKGGARPREALGASPDQTKLRLDLD